MQSAEEYVREQEAAGREPDLDKWAEDSRRVQAADHGPV